MPLMLRYRIQPDVESKHLRKHYETIKNAEKRIAQKLNQGSLRDSWNSR